MRPSAWVSLILLMCLLLANSGWLVGAEVLIIRSYQRLGAPFRSYLSSCRFTPTCSHYALQSLEETGFWHGNLRIATRFVDCSPIGLLGGSLGISRQSSSAGPTAD